MERIVIAVYQPKPGKSEQLKELCKKHWDRLNELGLASERRPVLMESENGSIVEVFGWKSKEAIEEAHTHPRVLAMWDEYNALCDYVPIQTVPEAEKVFSEFAPIN